MRNARMSLDIIGRRDPANLRSPYSDSRESLNPPIHAVGLNRSGIQRTLLGAPKTRIERSNQAAEARDSTGASYEELTRVAT